MKLSGPESGVDNQTYTQALDLFSYGSIGPLRMLIESSGFPSRQPCYIACGGMKGVMTRLPSQEHPKLADCFLLIGGTSTEDENHYISNTVADDI